MPFVKENDSECIHGGADRERCVHATCLKVISYRLISLNSLLGDDTHAAESLTARLEKNIPTKGELLGWDVPHGQVGKSRHEIDDGICFFHIFKQEKNCLDENLPQNFQNFN